VNNDISTDRLIPLKDPEPHIEELVSILDKFIPTELKVMMSIKKNKSNPEVIPIPEDVARNVNETTKHLNKIYNDIGDVGSVVKPEYKPTTKPFKDLIFKHTKKEVLESCLNCPHASKRPLHPRSGSNPYMTEYNRIRYCKIRKQDLSSEYFCEVITTKLRPRWCPVYGPEKR
jgi:hypothetical protein